MGSVDKEILKPKRVISPEHREKMRQNMAKAMAARKANIQARKDILEHKQPDTTNQIEVIDDTTSDSSKVYDGLQVNDNGLDRNGVSDKLQSWIKSQSLIGKYANQICINILRDMKNLKFSDRDGAVTGRNALSAFGVLFDKLRLINEGKTDISSVKVYQFFEVKPGDVLDVNAVNAEIVP